MANITINVRLALLGEELETKYNVNLEIDENGVIQHIGNGYTSDTPSITFNNGLLLPAFANSHVHSADFAFPEIGLHSTLKELVGDPNSIKYELFQNFSDDEISKYIESYINLMKAYGVITALDFREQGIRGSILANKIRKKQNNFNYLILGRLEKEEFNRDNLDLLSRVADGYGVPSIASYTEEEMKLIRDYFKNKLIAVHVSETLKQNLKGDFKITMRYLEPKLLIHATHLSVDELLEIKEKYKNTYIVICPRSNLWFSSGIPKVAEILKNNLNLLIGTDNAAWINPNVLEEAEFALMLSRFQEPQSDYSKEILKAITVNAKDFGVTPIHEGSKANFIIIEGEHSGIFRAKNKYSAIIKRGRKILFTNEELSKILN